MANASGSAVEKGRCANTPVDERKTSVDEENTSVGEEKTSVGEEKTSVEREFGESGWWFR